MSDVRSTLGPSGTGAPSCKTARPCHFLYPRSLNSFDLFCLSSSLSIARDERPSTIPSSGDLTEIGRKFLEAWKGEPFTKFILISNNLLNFNDEVLITRFIVLEFNESFLHREDTTLKRTALPAELPSIANRCLAAYRRLLRRGRFIQPASGLALLERAKAAVTPFVAFMDNLSFCKRSIGVNLKQRRSRCGRRSNA